MALGMVCLARAETYSAHFEKSEMDFDLSSKSVGLVKWQYFFDQFVAATTSDEPTNYDALQHACYL